MSREPKLRLAGAGIIILLAAGIVFVGQPTLDERYNKVTFDREVNGEKVKVSAEAVLADRSVFVSPAESFKAIYNQAMNPVFLDVRQEADFNLYHIVDAINVPVDRIPEVIPALLTEPAANTVYIVMSNDETAAIQAWKTLVASGVPNVYILQGGVNNWIASFGKDELAEFSPNPAAGDDELKYIFPAALGDRYASCNPSPIEYENLTFEARIKLQLKRDKSGGGCG